MNAIKKPLILLLFVAVCCIGYANEVTLQLCVEHPGTLKSLLGDEMLQIEKLILRGELSESDFTTMRECCQKGRLHAIDISRCKLQEDMIPEKAFYDPNIQNADIRLQLDEFIFPEYVWAVGSEAFKYTKLKNVNISRCMYVMRGAFEGSAIENLSIGWSERFFDRAFALTNIEEFDIPYVFGLGNECFFGCKNLKKLNLYGSYDVGDKVAASCDLRSVTYSGEGFGALIQDRHFADNHNLKEIEFPDRTFFYGEEVLASCPIETIILSGYTEFHSDNVFFNLSGLKTIYCNSQVPPSTSGASQEDETTQYYPFGGSTPQDTEIYVPFGSSELYRSSEGWNYFHNFIETDKFPTLGITSASVGDPGIEVSGKRGAIRMVNRNEIPVKYSVYLPDGTWERTGVLDPSVEITLSSEQGVHIVRFAKYGAFKILVK